MGYILLAILIDVGISFVESFVIAFLAGLFGLDIQFKIIFFVVVIFNLFFNGSSK